MKLALTALAAAGAALAACAPYEPAPGAPGVDAAASAPAAGQCFRVQDMRNHTIGDNRTLYVDMLGGDTYRITMKGSCLVGAISSDAIVTRQPPGSSIVCKPIDLDLSMHRDGFTVPCIVDSIAKMTPEEVAALPPRLRP